jgi:hypothetical protein
MELKYNDDDDDFNHAEIRDSDIDDYNNFQP